MDITKITSDIAKLYKSKGRLHIGIDGLGGAGKSTFSAELESAVAINGIPVTVFHMDDFIHPKAVRYNDDYPQWEQYYYLQLRYDYFRDSVALPFREGRELPPVELYIKDFDTYMICCGQIPAEGIIITEGIFLQREELSGLFNYMIYIDVAEEERLERVLSRDRYIGDEAAIREKYENRYFPAERYYNEKYAPAARADAVI